MIYIKLLLVAIIVSLFSLLLHYLNGANVSLGLAINIVISSIVSMAIVALILKQEERKRQKASKRD